MRGFFLLALALLIASCSDAPKRYGAIDQRRILTADSEPQNWLTAGRDFGKTHYSPLQQINRGNVRRLSFAWAFETGTNRVLEATPIVADGVMYASGPLGRVWALDARTGKQLWNFTPQVDGQINRKACCDQANRGVAVWQGKVYVAALDGVLYALDARNGAVLWRADTIADKTRGYTITGAPEIAKDSVIIGNAGDEYDVRGYVSAYGLKTGALKWRFFTAPNENGKFEDPALAFAEKTWSKKARHDLGGGAAPYDAILYDPTTNLVFVGTGNAGPYPRALRDPGGGDNLFVCSVLALDAETGKLVWRHQQTPADQWDFTATQPMILADLRIAGQKRAVLMQAPKNGFFYVYDRRSGEILSAEKYARATWAKGVDLKTGRPMENPEADYSKGPKLVSPAMFGAHNWNPMAFSPKTGLVYIPAIDGAAVLWSPNKEMRGAHRRRPGIFNPGAIAFLADQIKHAPQSLPPPVREALPRLIRDPSDLDQKAYLRAWDPVARKAVWQMETSGWHDRGGVLATGGGLVFQGSTNGQLRVFDDRTGNILHTIETGSSILAAPMTYRIGGIQYVSVMAAWGGGGWGYPHAGDAYLKYGNAGRILTFKLNGGPTPLPALLPPTAPIPKPPELRASPAQIAKGAMLFGQNCALCHSNMTGALAPDLRRMNADTHAAFNEIVLRGALKENGMPAWGDVLTRADAAALHAYLISQTQQAHHAPH